MPEHDPETDALIAEIERAGLVTIGTDAEGHETWTLTPQGAQVGRQMAMSAEDDALDLLTALLDARMCEWPAGIEPQLDGED
jgi:hypothetical protein